MSATEFCVRPRADADSVLWRQVMVTYHHDDTPRPDRSTLNRGQL